MKRSVVRRVYVVGLTLAALLVPATASAASCTELAFTLPTASIAHPVLVQSAAHPSVTYDGTVFRPANPAQFPGLRPAVMLMHGRGANQCALWWAARLLAGQGYIALTVTQPYNNTTSLLATLLRHIDATRSGVRFLRSAASPLATMTDPARIAIAAHSLGTGAASVVQTDEPGVQAIVALDNLKARTMGDPGGAVQCLSTAGPHPPVTPHVPALGAAMDHPCSEAPDKIGYAQKKFGYEAWRAAGLPSMELVFRDYVHNDFVTPPPSYSAAQKMARARKLRRVGWYLSGWLDRWLLAQTPADETAAENRLLTHSVFGHNVIDILSRPYASTPHSSFASSAYLPGRIDCEDLSACLATP
jgi:dienelactone hydrolase